jgi:large subunit ribosomal protein L29
MKAKEVREMSTEELTAKVASLKEELFNLRFQLAVNNLDNTARIGEVKKGIAQCKTIIQARALQANA